MEYIIVIQIMFVIALTTYLYVTMKQINYIKKIKEKVNNDYILKEIINTTGKHIGSKNKIKRINEKILENLQVEYSSIIFNNGVKESVLASNLPKKYQKILKLEVISKALDLENEINENKNKYVTLINEKFKLPINVETVGSKSYMFLPLYADKRFMGYWLLESERMNAFDDFEEQMLNEIKEAIVDTIFALSYERSLETFVRTDEFTTLKSNEYLLTEGKKVLEKYDESILVMYKINNIIEINEKYSREIGNIVIGKIGKALNDRNPNNITVRYFGNKFMTIYKDEKIDISNEENITEFKNKIKKEVFSSLNRLKFDSKMNEDKFKVEISVVVTKYQKGNDLDLISKKLENKIDSINENEILFI